MHAICCAFALCLIDTESFNATNNHTHWFSTSLLLFPFIIDIGMLLGGLLPGPASITQSSLWRQFRRTPCLGGGQVRFLSQLGLGIRRFPGKAIDLSVSLRQGIRGKRDHGNVSIKTSIRAEREHTANVPAPQGLPPLTSLRSANSGNVFLYPKGT